MTPLAELLRTLAPRLRETPVVYAVVAPGFDGSAALATVREREGLTVVVDQDVADDDGLLYDFVGAWISLDAVSDLAATGLTAAVSEALSGAGIACNVMAGFHHDHLVVPWDRRHDAMDVLHALG